jgi:uncharacterized protein YjeT (DUF2065 family)
MKGDLSTTPLCPPFRRRLLGDLSALLSRQLRRTGSPALVVGQFEFQAEEAP